MTKGLEGSFLHYGVRKQDLFVKEDRPIVLVGEVLSGASHCGELAQLWIAARRRS